jgi:uncharacterized protein
LPVSFVAGAGVGVLGGMIGLGGAEFRLPLLIGVFGFVALAVVIVNKVTSLIVVVTAIPDCQTRGQATPSPNVANQARTALGSYRRCRPTRRAGGPVRLRRHW